MKLSVDLGYTSVNHYGEELCGDRVEIVHNDDCKIIILADGMGHGIRANILATLTSKIIATMMKNKIDVDELFPTIAKTLPISSVNGVAYSTFSVIQIFNDGEVYIIEYDNPECIFIRDGKLEKLPFTYREIEGKKIRECRFKGKIGDTFAIMSDGCIYCGAEQVINYFWDWDALAAEVLDSNGRVSNATQLSKRVNQMCVDLYDKKPTDDTTIAVAKIIEEKAVNIMTGVPQDKSLDGKMVTDFSRTDGLKIVCGGVTGQVVARELHERLQTGVHQLDPEIPPTSTIRGIDLVTEGVITLHKAVELLDRYSQNDVSEDFFEELSRENGATRIVCYLMEDCTTVNLFVGKALNEAYESQSMPFDLTARQGLIIKLERILERMDKKVNIYYY